MYKSSLLILIFSIINVPLHYGQSVSEQAPPEFIKTITFSIPGSLNELPVIELGQPLILEFDDINGNEADYYYTIEHFNFDWTPSVLAKAEYMSGLDNQRIFEYYNSFNAYQMYSHYRLKIPNNQLKGLLKTGNYLLSIYNDIDELVLSRKFIVYKDEAAVGVQVKRSRDMAHINTKQNIEIKINPRNTLTNPAETVKTKLIQNNNLKTAITDLKPQYILGKTLSYRYNEESSFWAGNEYFFFDTKDVRAANNSIQFIDLDDIYQSYLFTNIQRSNLPYTYNPDINGTFKVNALNTSNTSIEADYTNVHFSLDSKLLENQNVFVYGNFNNFELNESNLMAYDPIKKRYQCNLKFKQGFYNYKFVVLDSYGNLNEGAISGNHWQTENNYKVIVYYRPLGGRYDQVIGYGGANSSFITN